MRKITLLMYCILLFANSFVKAQTFTIQKIAGRVLVPSGIPAIDAQLNGCRSLVLDTANNIVFADMGNDVVQKVSTFGIMTTVCGTGTQAFSGDGGPATAADVFRPTGVVMDKKGNLYFTDPGNYRVRKVDKYGVVTTFAGNGVHAPGGDGGPATNASFSTLSGITIDKYGDIYVADAYACTIREIDTLGNINTIAGNGTYGYTGDGGQATSAEFNSPIGLAFDTAGNLYIADESNNVIRKVNKAGVVTTFAGNGTAGYSGDGGMAALAQLKSPYMISFDTHNNLLIADELNYVIRKVNASGVITTVAGNHISGNKGYGGPATAAEIIVPTDAVMDKSGNMYITDDGGAILKVDTTGIITRIVGIDNINNTVEDSMPAIYSKLGEPFGVTVDALGNVYSVDNSYNRVRKINAAGIITTLAGSNHGGYWGDGGLADTAELGAPTGAGLDLAGNVFIADQVNNRIRRVDTKGIITTYAGTGVAGSGGPSKPATKAQFNAPFDVVVDGSGNVYVSDQNNNMVRKIAPKDSSITNFISSWSKPRGLALDTKGNLYVADQTNEEVKKVTPAGSVSVVAGTGSAGFSGDGGSALSAKLYWPVGVAVDRYNNIYISDNNNNRIREVNSSGVITTIAGNGTAGYSGDGGPATAAELNSPYNIAVDSVGDVYIADGNNNMIRVLCPNPSAPSAIQGTTSACVGSSYIYYVPKDRYALSYTWTLPSGWTGSSTDSAITVTAGGSSGTLSVVANGGCGYISAPQSISVTSHSLPAVTVSPSIAKICQGDSIGLSANGGLSYLWSTGSTNDSIAVKPATTATYSVAVNNGICTKDTAITVTVDLKPLITLTGKTEICTGMPDTLMASGGTSYLWNTGSTSNSIEVNPVVTTTYSVTANSGVCSKDTVVTLTVDSMPLITLTGKSAICAGMADTLSVVGGTSYVWSTGSTNSTIIVNPATNASYSVNVKSGACLKDTIISIAVNSFPVLNITGKDTILLGSKDTLIANGATTYKWVGGSNNDTDIVSPSADSTFTVIGTNAAGCTDTLTFYVTVNVITGIKDISGNVVSVFPNPFTTTTTIVFNTNGRHYLELTDVTGRTLRKMECTGSQYELNRNGLSAGVYFIKAYDEGQKYMAVSKLVVE